MKSKAERINMLVENLLKEVRLPAGYFKVLNDFSFKDSTGEWDVPFKHGDILYMDPTRKTLQTWRASSSSWEPRDISFKSFIKPEVYRTFADNTFRVNPLDVKNKIVKPGENIEFKTTVGYFNNRAHAYNLSSDTKIRVQVID
jgi:hypothetical protein